MHFQHSSSHHELTLERGELRQDEPWPPYVSVDSVVLAAGVIITRQASVRMRGTFVEDDALPCTICNAQSTDIAMQICYAKTSVSSSLMTSTLRIMYCKIVALGVGALR